MHPANHSGVIRDHVHQQFSKQEGIQSVNVLVAGPNFHRFCYISAREAMQYIP
jgi:hypothetical protein